MTCHTEGIRQTSPVKWRGLDGLMSVFWKVESEAGASGYYLSPDPRIMVFFTDISPHIRMSNSDRDLVRDHRPMKRAIYVPAGVPLWTRTTAVHRFSHLDLHIHKDRLLRFLSPSVGASAAAAALRRMVEIQDVGAVEALAGLLVDEVVNPLKHAVYAESLVGSIFTSLLDIPASDGELIEGKLGQAQMDELISRIHASSEARLTVSEMAATVGLSESRFSHAFKQTTGQTPLQWQLGRRIDLARKLLLESDLTVAGIAAQLGFSDQAHLTKAFRQVVGETPAAWRRLRHAV